MKENKNVRIEIRMTPIEKEKLKEFAAKHNTTISELVRQALTEFINKLEKEVK